jgi:hypothetical protein
MKIYSVEVLIKIKIRNRERINGRLREILMQINRIKRPKAVH